MDKAQQCVQSLHVINLLIRLPLGLSASTPFLRGLLDKWEIVPQAFAREEYKAVVQQFTDKQYSKANREATQALLQSYINQIVDDVAESRGLSADQVNCQQA